MSNPRPFVVDPVLTSIAIGYSNDAQMLIADRVLPRFDVAQEKFKYLEFPIGQSFSVPDNLIGRRGRVNQVEFSSKEVTDSVNDYGLEDPIPYTDIDAAQKAREQGRSTYDPEAYATMQLTKLNQLAREVRTAKLVQDPASYASNRRITLSGTDKLSDYANSKPIQLFKAAINGTLVYRANTLVMGHNEWQVVNSHPHIVNAIKGNVSNQGIVTKQELAELLEIKEVIVGEGYLNIARKGQDAQLERVWGGSIQALYIDPTARPDHEMSFGFTAEYGTRIAGRIEDPKIGIEGGTVIRSGERVKELITAKDLGFQISNSI